MAEILRIFVSATRDLEPQRAVIGRVVAELPVQVGTEIRRSPADGATYERIFELIGNCDRVYFLLGRDITAPAGVEWDLAFRLERSLLPLRRPGSLTPAAQEFLRLAQVEWVTFENDEELARIVGLDLIDLLLHPTNRYGLTVSEIARLQQRRQSLRESQVPASAEAGGAEGGGVILDSLRREPLEGRLVRG